MSKQSARVKPSAGACCSCQVSCTTIPKKFKKCKGLNCQLFLDFNHSEYGAQGLWQGWCYACKNGDTTRPLLDLTVGETESSLVEDPPVIRKRATTPLAPTDWRNFVDATDIPGLIDYLKWTDIISDAEMGQWLLIELIADCHERATALMESVVYQKHKHLRTKLIVECQNLASKLIDCIYVFIFS